MFTLPPIVDDLVTRGWVGTKSGQGFYKKDAGGEILTLDPASMTYRPGAPARLRSLDAARAIEDPGARIKALSCNRASDKVGRFLRETLGPTLVYAARVAPEVAYSIDDVDRAMQWGFGWELGPFETWDAIGIEQVLEACHVSRPAAARTRGTRARRLPSEACRPPVRAGAASRAGTAAAAHREGANRRSCGETPAPAWSISETTCSPSSSTRR